LKRDGFKDEEDGEKYMVVKELFTDLMPKKYALRAMEEIQILGQI
jgi:hypothetical protein